MKALIDDPGVLVCSSVNGAQRCQDDFCKRERDQVNVKSLSRADNALF